jgi:hypothetical protein
MEISLLLRVSKEALPYRTSKSEEVDFIKRLIHDELALGYVAAQEDGSSGEMATLLSITPDGRALMALRQAELDRKSRSRPD